MSPNDDECAKQEALIPDDLTLAEFAAEFLRRDPDYRQDFHSLPDGEDRANVAATLARRWGLRFRSGSGRAGSARSADLAYR